MIQLEWKWNTRTWGFEKLGTLVQGLRDQWVLYLGPLHIHKWRMSELGDD